MQKKNAFTLIELLVVVLIIGILVAIAVPQYQKAVLKTKIMQFVTASKAIYDAQQVYYLENNRYATTNDVLPISYKTSGTAIYLIFSYGYCDIHLSTTINCFLDKPFTLIQRPYNSSEMTCCSYPKDNYAGDVVCQALKPGVSWGNGCGTSVCHCYK